MACDPPATVVWIQSKAPMKKEIVVRNLKDIDDRVSTKTTVASVLRHYFRNVPRGSECGFVGGAQHVAPCDLGIVNRAHVRNHWKTGARSGRRNAGPLRGRDMSRPYRRVTS